MLRFVAVLEREGARVFARVLAGGVAVRLGRVRAGDDVFFARFERAVLRGFSRFLGVRVRVVLPRARGFDVRVGRLVLFLSFARVARRFLFVRSLVLLPRVLESEVRAGVRFERVSRCLFRFDVRREFGTGWRTVFRLVTSGRRCLR